MYTKIISKIDDSILDKYRSFCYIFLIEDLEEFDTHFPKLKDWYVETTNDVKISQSVRKDSYFDEYVLVAVYLPYCDDAGDYKYLNSKINGNKLELKIAKLPNHIDKKNCCMVIEYKKKEIANVDFVRVTYKFSFMTQWWVS